MNEYTTQPVGDREAISAPSNRPGDDAAAEAAAETMRRVAAVSRRLKSASSALQAIVQAASGGSDLTLTHWLILARLSRNSSSRQCDLDADAGLTSGYLTRVLDELDAKGMIQRRRSTEDRRQILLNLTDRGRDLTRALLSAIDRQRLLDALDKLQSSLDRFLSASAPDGRRRISEYLGGDQRARDA